MSLNDIINEFDKDNSVTTEQLASRLLDKNDLSIKTEIPFVAEVWKTALRKDMCDLIGQLFSNVEVIDKNGKLQPLEYELINDKGEKVKVKFGDLVSTSLKRQINYSEEYAISHKRKGRTELTSVLGKKIETQTQKQDTLSKVMGK